MGRDLIRASELLNLYKQVEKFNTAVNTFRLKYNCLPGDCLNATAFWSTDTTCDGATVYNNVPKTATCNGDGNGIIIGTGGVEQWRFWQQLANANLIPGSFTGVWGADFGDMPGLNVPESVIPQAGFTLYHTSQFPAGTPSLSFGNWPTQAHFLRFGFHSVSGGPFANNFRMMEPALPAADTAAMDTKYDDGKAGTGRIQGNTTGDAWAHTCSPDWVAPGTYNITVAGAICSPMFVMDF